MGPASLTDTTLTPAAAIAAARGAHGSAVGDRPIVRFLLVELNDRAAPRPAQPMWVILSAGVSNPLFGDVESLREGLPTFVASYGWVFLDAEGQALGATKISYSEPPPQLPDG